MKMDDGYLALRWNNHNAIFSKIISLMREQESYIDVSLACSGHLYPAHKFVLSTCSDYFKEMFSKNPCKHPIVFMKDVSTKDMEALLDFMYKGEVSVLNSELGSLLRTAEALQVKGLAVPDDSSQNAAKVPVGSGGSLLRLPPDLVAVNLSKKPVKRKREQDRRKKGSPPKLIPRPGLKNRPPIPTPSDPGTSESASLPEGKRRKKEASDKKPTGAKGAALPAMPLYTESENSDDNASELENGDVSKAVKVKVERCESVNSEDFEDPPSEEDGGDREEDEEGEEGENGSELEDDEDNCTRSLDSAPNSEMSAAELLQVDLSEDGTQFIIGPGLFSDIGTPDLDRDESDQKKPFVCPLCGQSFTRRDNLANHIKTHTGDRPFMCRYCLKCFSRKDYLKQHERIHTGEKPYACEVCGRAFTRKEGLTDHMRCHSDLKEFACETCGKSFKQKCGLRFHKRNYKH